MTESTVFPILPSEVDVKKAEAIPSEVVAVFNKLIAEKWNGFEAHIKQDEAVSLAAEALGISQKEVFARKWLDVEFLFTRAGWDVKYDKPAYNEDYEAYFEFRKPRNRSGWKD